MVRNKNKAVRKDKTGPSDLQVAAAKGDAKNGSGIPEGLPFAVPALSRALTLSQVLDHAAQLAQVGLQTEARQLLTDILPQCQSLTPAVTVPDLLVQTAMLLRTQHPAVAAQLLEDAVAQDPHHISGWSLLASLRDRLGDANGAREACIHIVNAASATPEQVLGAASLLIGSNEEEVAFHAAIQAFEQLGRPLAWASSLLCIALEVADWPLATQLTDQLRQAHRSGQTADARECPDTHVHWCDDEATNIEVVKDWSARNLQVPDNVVAPLVQPLEGRRIRVGYLSGDFREHPTSRLINGLLRHHDHSQFELFMYCSGWDDQSNLRKEIEKHFDHIYSVAKLSDADAAQLIRSHGIDILVELHGPTRANRMGILAHRPAPIQIDYLGWPGSVGGRVVDYVVGDDHTIPAGVEALYPEKVIRIRQTYQVNDYAARTLPTAIQRKDVGLPQDERIRVLGMFNAINRVGGDVWEAWMRILKAVPGTVMWLLDPGLLGRKHIARVTKAAGVDPQRIIVAPILNYDAHLGRLPCCDLMLDPWPSSEGSSIGDALFAGVPVLAMEGKNFAGRISGSLLKAAGMQALVQPDVESYVRIAVQLLRHATELQRIKQHIKDHIATTDVFDAQGKARQLEVVYRNVMGRKLKGLPAMHVRVGAAPTASPREKPGALMPEALHAPLPTVHACIISWTGKHDNAIKIANQIALVTNKVSIVYSDASSDFEPDASCDLIRTDNNLFWGDKFKHSIEACDSDVLLIIHGDCSSKDWKGVVEHCRRAYQQDKNLGLWAPLTTGTVFPLQVTSLFELQKDKLNAVAYIDGIVFAMQRKVVERMRRLDYSGNVYGWGIDWFAAAYSYSQGLSAKVDAAISIDHPVDRGYRSESALHQMKVFMQQMTEKEKSYHALIRSHTRYARVALRGNTNSTTLKSSI